MRFFVLVAVALAVVPTTFAFPVFKRSDTHLDEKDQKSERTNIIFKGNVNQFHSSGCGTGVGVITYGSTMNCGFQTGGTQGEDNGYGETQDPSTNTDGFPPNGNGFPPNGNGFPPNGNGFPPNGNGFPSNFNPPSTRPGQSAYPYTQESTATPSGKPLFGNGLNTAGYDPTFSNMFGKEAKKDSDNAV